MSDYSKTTNFTAKDALTTGNPAKLVKGSDLDTEFDAIAVASATKADLASPTFTGTVSVADGANDLNIASHDGTNGLQLAGTLVTSTAAELNVLDGITPTVTELNYVNGVTSAIQTQIDACVKDTGDETIAGAKTFTSNPTISNTAPVLYVKDSDHLKSNVAMTTFVELSDSADAIAGRLGFSSGATDDLNIINNVTNGNVNLQPQGTGEAQVNGNEIVTTSSGTQTIAGTKTFTTNPTISVTSPGIKLYETDAAVDNRRWELRAGTEAIKFAAVNDAESVESLWLQVDRTGTTIDTVNFANGTLQYGGAEVYSVGGTAITAGDIAITSETDTSTSTTGTGITLNASQYMFLPRLKSSSASGDAFWAAGLTGSIYHPLYSTGTTSYERRGTLATNNASYTATMQVNYVSASQPYELGGELAHSFIYMIIDNATKNIEAVKVSETPIWVGNGPSQTIADKHGSDGKQYIVRKVLPDRLLTPLPPSAPLKERIQRQKDILAARKNLVEEEIELTPAMKNADMNLIPHPYMHNDNTGKTVVMLDPISDFSADLLELHNAGENVNYMLHDGYINIGNTPLPRSGPQGLMIVSADWKVTP